MKNFLRYAGIVIALMGSMLFATLYPHWNSAFSTPIDLKSNKMESKSQLRVGTAVDAELNLIMESFASKTVKTTTRGGNESRSVCYYSIVPVFVGEETYFVGLALSEKQLKTADDIIDNTLDYLYGKIDSCDEHYDITATIVDMDKEIYESMKEWFVEMEWFETEEEMKKYVLPLVIEKAESNSVKMGLLAGIGITALGLFSLIFSFCMDGKYGKRLKVLQKCTGKISVVLMDVEIDFPLRNLDDVDKAIWKGNKEKAKKLLCKTYHVPEAKAEDYIKRWAELTSPEELNK